MAVKKTKKTTRKKVKVAGRTAPNRRMPGWILLSIGMLFGLGVALIGYINGWVPKPDNPNSKPIAQTSKTISQSKIEDNSAELETKSKQDFDFYETLQDMEVVIDEEELQQTQARIPVNYILQLGSFKKLEDAEALKAQVAFVGLSAMIQTVTVNQTRWHRVRIGPYKSGRKADVDKRNLEKNGFNALILRQK
jgi:cell division protein FtsN